MYQYITYNYYNLVVLNKIVIEKILNIYFLNLVIYSNNTIFIKNKNHIFYLFLM